MLIGQYKRLENVKQTVNSRRFNKQEMQRKLRLASFVPFPRLVKGFHNHPSAK